MMKGMQLFVAPQFEHGCIWRLITVRTESLRSFMTVARAGSISAAAQQLYVSQQGLNKSITALEDELGAKLIIRSHSGIALTDNGKAVLAFAQRTLADLDRLKATLAESDKVDLFTGSILATPYACTTLYPVASSIDQVALTESPYEQILSDLVRLADAGNFDTIGMVDAFFDQIPKDPASRRISDDETLDFRPVFKTKLGVVVPSSHNFANHERLPLAELQGYAIGQISDPTIDEILDRLFGNRRPLSVFSTSNGGLFGDWIRANEAPALADSFLFSMFQKNGALGEDDVFIVLDTTFTDVVGFTYDIRCDDRRAKLAYIQQVTKAFDDSHRDYYQRFPWGRPKRSLMCH